MRPRNNSRARSTTCPRATLRRTRQRASSGHHQIELAQKYFDQGLAFDYGFNHDEAYQSFAAAAALDPKLAMANWGIALVLGPQLQPARQHGSRMKIAYGAIVSAPNRSRQRQQARKRRRSSRRSRNATGPTASKTPEREKAYANAMREVAQKYPDDPDVQALFAESMMDLHPWELWTHDGKPGGEHTRTGRDAGAHVIAKYPDHLGANHYYIHAVEASPHPERALPSAQRLATAHAEAGTSGAYAVAYLRPHRHVS